MFSTNTTFSNLVALLCAVSVVAASDDGTSLLAKASTNALQKTFCPQDIKLVDTDGVTSFPGMEDSIEAPVRIVSQDISTVTVELRQQWFPTVDSVHYAFFENHSREKCYESTSVDEGELYATVTIQCNAERPWGELSICLSDNEPNGNLLEGDAAEFPEHCHKVLPGIDHEEDNIKANDKPTVCYSLRIRCATLCNEDIARKRGLRRKTN